MGKKKEKRYSGPSACTYIPATITNKKIAITKDIINTITILTCNYNHLTFLFYYNTSQLKIQHQKIYLKQQTKPKKQLI